METTKRGRKVALLLGFLFVVLLAVLTFVNRTELRAWYLLWREFEGLGKNAQGYGEYRHKKTGIVFVRLPGGTFSMGASEEEVESVLREIGTGWGNLEGEQPRHEVTLRPFLISKYEVSQAKWQKAMEENPSRFKGDSLPVEQVSWNDCQDFCRRTGLSLPTEAQWEYACRAGTTERYAGTGKLDDMGWYKANSAGRTHPVGEKEPNGFGLYDMHGNVWEWCEDFSQHDFYNESAGAIDPLSESSGSGNRVYRGGCFYNLAQFCRSAFRYGSNPRNRNEVVGFRPSRSLFR